MSTDLARKFRIDLTTDLTLVASFVQLNGINDFDPGVTPNMEDTSAYDTNGVESSEVTMQSGLITATYFTRKNGGVEDPGQKLVRLAMGQFDAAARLGIRWYDKNGGPEAGSAVVIPQRKRATTGTKNVESWTATFTVTDGVLNLNITNPAAGALVPSLAAATPAAATAAHVLILTGANFTGTTGVTVGGVAVSSFVFVSDSQIAVVMPTGSAGSAPIIVTNAAGAGASFPYTRGA